MPQLKVWFTSQSILVLFMPMAFMTFYEHCGWQFCEQWPSYMFMQSSHTDWFCCSIMLARTCSSRRSCPSQQLRLERSTRQYSPFPKQSECGHLGQVKEQKQTLSSTECWSDFRRGAISLTKMYECLSAVVSSKSSLTTSRFPSQKLMDRVRWSFFDNQASLSPSQCEMKMIGVFKQPPLPSSTQFLLPYVILSVTISSFACTRQALLSFVVNEQLPLTARSIRSWSRVCFESKAHKSKGRASQRGAVTSCPQGTLPIFPRVQGMPQGNWRAAVLG